MRPLTAARAIYDFPIEGALSALAGTLRCSLDPADRPFIIRALAARDLLRRDEDTEDLAYFANDARSLPEYRIEALSILASWREAPERDRVLNVVRPRPARRNRELDRVAPARLARILSDPDGNVAGAAARAAAILRIEGAAEQMLALARNAETAPAARVAMVQALEELHAPDLGDLAVALLQDPDPDVRAAASRALAAAKPATALPVLRKLLQEGSTPERQGALRSLGRMTDQTSERLLASWTDDVTAGRAPAELRLDVLEAVRDRARGGRGAMARWIKDYELGLDQGDPLARWRPCLEGGDPAAGRRVFIERTETACVRCHAVDGFDDPSIARAGPDLKTVGARCDRTYLLESIVDPNRQIAEGYQMDTLDTTEEGLLSGRVVAEDDDILTIETQDTGRPERHAIPKRDITDRRSESTAMPADLAQKMTRVELRDLISYLAGLGR